MSIMAQLEPGLAGSARLLAKQSRRYANGEREQWLENSFNNLFRLLDAYRVGIYDGHLKSRIGDATRLVAVLDAAGATRFQRSEREVWVQQVLEAMRSCARDGIADERLVAVIDDLVEGLSR